MALIDLDEFFVLPKHDTIQAFLAEYGHLEAIAVNWKMFGTSGHQRREPGLVIERFARCAPRTFGGNRSIKTLARVDAIEMPRVHTCHFREGVRYPHGRGRGDNAESAGRSREVSHDVIWLQPLLHPLPRGVGREGRKGRGAKPAGHPLKHRTETEFVHNDRNDEEDTAILARREELQRLLEQL